MDGDGEEGDFPGLSLFELHGIAKQGGPKYDQISLTTLTTHNGQILLEEMGHNLNQIIWPEAYFESVTTYGTQRRRRPARGRPVSFWWSEVVGNCSGQQKAGSK